MVVSDTLLTFIHLMDFVNLQNFELDLQVTSWNKEQNFLKLLRRSICFHYLPPDLYIMTLGKK